MSRQTLDLGVVGNCIVGALVDRNARIVWWCLPRLDGDPVFCNLLAGDDDTGYTDVEMDRIVASEQAYMPNTAILQTTLTDQTGASIRITDFVPRFRQFDRIYRPGMLFRRIEPVSGLARIRIRIRPRFGYGAFAPTCTVGSNHIRYVSPENTLRVTTDGPVAYLEGEHTFVLTEPIMLIFGPDESFTASITHVAREFFGRTREYWVDWSRSLAVPFEWQEAVIRAAITLKLCAFQETGAIVAALTTSVPEAADTPRNWDYRHCWLRDSYFVVQALNRLGATRTMQDFLRYITSVAAMDPAGRLKPVYGIVPDAPLDEHIVPHLAGYRGMGPVRVGNQAAMQVQNDVYGSVILAAAQTFFDMRLPEPGDLALLERLEKLGEQAAKLAFEPDAGLWEYRGRARIHTHSVAMCWAACHRLAKIASALGDQQRVERWRGEADRIRKRILAEAWSPERNSFVESFGGKDLDASLLLLQEIGFLSASDPRFVSTLEAIERELRRGDHLLRYAAPDDFGEPTTAFNVCSFWYIDALAAVGRRDEARELFEKLLASRNHLGMLSEDIDPATGELWGNFPQTYSMVGVIVCAMRLSKSWEEAFWRGS
ncbi:glycoside hydrolase family 15 protein [Desertibaculum subflavum]|uniref:glycoside hydrolase family 15 protein n=1 Tax=Desertibaculum subflavum TaxID=2268458 RepID=UPI000E667163